MVRLDASSTKGGGQTKEKEKQKNQELGRTEIEMIIVGD